MSADRALLAPGAAPSGGGVVAPGPYRSSQIRDGDDVELSNGHRIQCLPAGFRHGNANILGGAVLASDPATRGQVGADVGVSFNEEKNLRAPDLLVAVEPGPGWQDKAPPLAVEYASVGQDEDALQAKIVELLEAGTRLIWVVRLVGPLRVDIHERGAPRRTVGADADLVAPGVLDNPIPVRALVEPDAALAAVLRNMLSPHGVRTLAELRRAGVRAGRQSGKREGERKGQRRGKLEGKLEGIAESLLEVLRTRGLTPTADDGARISACTDPVLLRRWLRRAVSAATAAEALED